MKSLKNKMRTLALALMVVCGVLVANPKQAKAWPTFDGLYVTKILNKPSEGVTTPEETFKFKMTPYSYNGDTSKTEGFPEMLPMGVKYTADDDADYKPEVDGKQIVKYSNKAIEDSNIYGNVKRGVYTYLLTEVPGTTEYMTYSKASYYITFIFDGSVPFDSILIRKVTDDDGNPVEDKKLEYEKGGNDKLIFNNYYDKKDGNDNPGGGTEITEDDKKAFALRKTIAEANPSTTYNFVFKFKVEKPAGSKSPDTGFDYYIVKNDGTAGDKQTGEYGSDITVYLKHNERVVLGKTLLGSTVTVEETDAGVYTGSVKESMFNGTKGQTNTGIIGDQAGGSYVEYKNIKQTPTGLLIDNLPFIALVAVAGAGIFFFVKNRKEEACA